MCYVGNIFNATSPGGIAVFVNSSGRLGTVTSSRGFKKGIQRLAKVREALYALQPVIFRYNENMGPEGFNDLEFGLVAEDIEKLNPELVVRDKAGKPDSVRYQQVNAILAQLVSRRALSPTPKLAEQEKRIEALMSDLQKVSAGLDAR